MKAARIHEYGDAGVIRFDDIPRPSPGPGEVLVRQTATSFNPSEVGLRLGLLEGKLDITLPHTLGWDLAGVVAETGPGVTRWSPGDAVFGLVGGSAAEYAIAPEGELAAAPASIPLAHAAAIPVAGLTAWQAVHEEARISPGLRSLANPCWIAFSTSGCTMNRGQAKSATPSCTSHSTRSRSPIRIF